MPSIPSGDESVSARTSPLTRSGTVKVCTAVTLPWRYSLVLTGIALALTLLVMRPVWMTVYSDAVEPFQNDQITLKQALVNAEAPLKKYMLAQTNNKAMAQIMTIAGIEGDAREQDLTIVTPAYLLSELKTAFQIGFILFIPFLVIDLVVASVLMAMGMMMLSPLIISLPFKLMVFVLVDGWSMTVGTLAASFGGGG